MSRITLLTLMTLVLAGCTQRAGRFKATKSESSAKPEARAVSPVGNWLAPRSTPADLPIEFVSSDQPRWRELPDEFPPQLTDNDKEQDKTKTKSKITIKVPRGLPDPTPLIPAANPPTAGKWRLGRKIFFEPVLTPPGTRSTSCADCHKPGRGFADDRDVNDEGTRNTLSLLNVAFNREQFWDGRVRTLEETVLPLEETGAEKPTRVKTLEMHRFSGVADRLDAMPDYRAEFKDVFGIDRVTQDAVAKALATYLRTLLSGDSVYDRAKAASPPLAPPGVEQFKAALDEGAYKRIVDALPPNSVADRDDLAARMAEGQAVFLGKGACARCHTPGLFTNQQYYNTTIVREPQSQGRETGRFNALPIGVKDFSLRGAYRTPTLRNLSATGPYAHNGRFSKLRDVIEWYSFIEDEPNLAQPLREMVAAAGPTANSLMSQPEGFALWCYLLSLDGQPVDSRLLHR